MGRAHGFQALSAERHAYSHGAAWNCYRSRMDCGGAGMMGSRSGAQRAFGLVGVLAAAAVAAIGLPILLRTSLSALRAGAEAERFERAAIHASGMAAAMRASPAAWFGRAMTYEVPAPAEPHDKQAAVDCGRASCNPEQIAVYDVTLWGEALRESLPGARGTVECVCPGRCRVVVCWPEAGGAREIALDVLLQEPPPSGAMS